MSDILITDGWTYTAPPQKAHQGGSSMNGGVGLHWKLYWDDSKTTTYKLWYKFYAWSSLNAGAQFAVRSTGTTTDPKKGFISIVYKTSSSGSENTIMKVPLTSPNNDQWFSMMQTSNNTPYNRWLPLKFNFVDSNYTSVDSFLSTAKNHGWICDSWSLPSTHTNGTVCEGGLTTASAISNITLGTSPTQIYIGLKCYNVQVARRINNTLYTKVITNGTYYDGSTTVVPDYFFPPTYAPNTTVYVGSGTATYAAQTNKLKTLIYNEIKGRRQPYSTTRPNATMGTATVVAGTTMTGGSNVVYDMIVNGLKKVDTSISYTTTAGTTANNLDAVKASIINLINQPIRASSGHGGCGSACMGLCVNVCAGECHTSCYFCTGNCDTSCVSTNTGGGDSCAGTCSNISYSSTSVCNNSNCTSVCRSGASGSSGGGGCFAPGTQITCENNIIKNIEDIRPGDIVLAYDDNTKQFIYKKVIRAYPHYNTPRLAKIIFNNNSELLITYGHPILTTEGWKSLDRQESLLEHNTFVNLLEINDKVISLNNELTIISIVDIPLEENYKSYNIEVDDCHTFIANDIVVHNGAKTGPPAMIDL